MTHPSASPTALVEDETLKRVENITNYFLTMFPDANFGDGNSILLKNQRESLFLDLEVKHQTKDIYCLLHEDQEQIYVTTKGFNVNSEEQLTNLYHRYALNIIHFSLSGFTWIKRTVYPTLSFEDSLESLYDSAWTGIT